LCLSIYGVVFKPGWRAPPSDVNEFLAKLKAIAALKPRSIA